jgi:hypothetical protein
MQTDAKPAEKRTAVEYLSFDEKTAKRAEWEAFEFTIVGPHLVEVANASYGFEKDDHTYTVGVAVREGVAFPAECECPADIHRDQDCKHKVALATVGGPVILEASANYPTESESSGRSNVPPFLDKLRADGGAATAGAGGDSISPYEASPDDCDCAELSDGFPCWPCVRDGHKELPD